MKKSKKIFPCRKFQITLLQKLHRSYQILTNFIKTQNHVKDMVKIWSAITNFLGWSGVAKVSCILHHRGFQVILAYIWAMPAVLAAGKDRGGMFLFLVFLHFHSCSSFSPVLLFHLLYYLFYLFSPFLWETSQNGQQGLMCH